MHQPKWIGSQRRFPQASNLRCRYTKPRSHAPLLIFAHSAWSHHTAKHTNPTKRSEAYCWHKLLTLLSHFLTSLTAAMFSSLAPYMKIRFFWCCDRTHKLSGSGLGPAEVPQSDFSLKAGSLHMNKILKFEFWKITIFHYCPLPLAVHHTPCGVYINYGHLNLAKSSHSWQGLLN